MHILSANEGNELFNRVWFIDSESIVDNIDDPTAGPMIHHPFLIVARYRRYDRNVKHDYIYWDDFSGFWDTLDQSAAEKTRTYVFAHNMGYDFSVLHGDEAMTRRGWTASPPFDSGPVFVMRYRKEQKTIVFLSSTNYYAASLRELGKVFGIDKMEIDYAAMSRAEAEPYAIRDLDILDTAVTRFREFVDEHNLGTMAPTLAKQAMNAFRHRFMRHEIALHNEDAVLQLERDAYFGGRVECFRVGKQHETLWKLDVNSMYPAEMHEQSVPVKLRWQRSHISLDSLRGYLDAGYSVVARCDLDTDLPVYPKIEQGTLLYPCGTFSTTLCTPEIVYALSHGHLHAIHDIAIYESAQIFRDYVDWFYPRKRDETDAVLKYMYKIFLNALYGKFGQRAYETLIVGESEPGDFGSERCYGPKRVLGADGRVTLSETEMEWYTLRRYGGIMARDVDGLTPSDREAFDSFTAIAAHITSGARIRLWSLIETAGRENVYYVDTDSLIVNAAGRERLAHLIDPVSLGMLKEEGYAEYADFRNPKDYTFGGETKRKGVSKNAVEIAPGVFRVVQWPSWRGHLARGGGDYQNVVREKRIDPVYTKGWVMADGSVEPLLYADNHLSLNDARAVNTAEIRVRYKC